MNIQRTKILIGIVSVIIPLSVAVLLFSPGKGMDADPGWISFLPHLNVMINSTASIILVAGFIFIKNGRRDLHRTAMISAFTLGCMFLVSYIAYHSMAASTIYGDLDGDGTLSRMEAETVGMSRNVYLLILLSHILLAAVVVPLVLFALYFALSGKFDKHKRIVRFAFPIWLYVSLTGVVVYLMISPYY